LRQREDLSTRSTRRPLSGASGSGAASRTERAVAVKAMDPLTR